MISIQNLSLSYQDVLFEKVNFNLQKGECLSILGPSGAGKSSLLQTIAGIRKADEGNVFWHKKEAKRNPYVIYLHQKPVLLPHLSVKENIQFALLGTPISRTEKKERVNYWMKQTKLLPHKEKKVTQLSGGQAQRVALARAMVVHPDLILLDEPFHALDFILKESLMEDLEDIFALEKISSILVTHDPMESLRLSDRFAWLENGTLSFYNSTKDFLSDHKTGIPKQYKYWKMIDL